MDFFIVGAPKCGTTSLYNYLDQHPEIYMSPIKEPTYFGSDLRIRRTVTTFQEYLELFQGANGQLRGEASVLYLYSRMAAKEIHDFNPDAKIIIMLRNPVDVMYSLHNQVLYEGNEDIKDFRLAIEAEHDRKRGLRIPRTCTSPDVLLYSEIVRFTSQIERYFDVFPREQVHIIILDEFSKNTLAVYRGVLRFLNVNQAFIPNIRVVNPSKQVYSHTLQKLIKEPIVRSVAKSLLPQKLGRTIIKGVKRINTYYAPHAPMDRELRKELQEQFADEMVRLSNLLNKDLTYWIHT